MRGPRGLVDLLWFLDLLAGRAEAVGRDFILAGSLNLWLRGLSGEPPQPYLILVASREGAPELRRALWIGAREEEWEPAWLKAVEAGLEARLVLRGYHVALLSDPVLRLPRGSKGYRAREMAREAGHVVLGRRVIRLAPLAFEAELGEALGEAPWLQGGGRGGRARR